MRAILNIIWLLFGGIWLALGYFLFGLLACVLIITIPAGIASFRMGTYALWPFGKTVVTKPTSGAGSALMNGIWFVIGGLWLAIGIGVNLSQTPGDTERPATCIAEHLNHGVASAPSVDEAAKALAETFGVWLDRWTTLGFQPILDAWIARTPGLHGPCTARLTNETLTGVADGVEADGSLRLKLLDGSLRIISAGDVFFGEAA